jgi:predicted ribosomally synthesized peptide with nif11-like leader
MSTANIPAFHDKVSQSPELQTRLAEIQRQAAEFTAQAIARIAVEVGTPLTAADLLANSELSDADLAGVAGGAVITSKKEVENDLSNLWGLLGTNYRYTTDDKGSFYSRKDYKIGDNRTQLKGITFQST